MFIGISLHLSIGIIELLFVICDITGKEVGNLHVILPVTLLVVTNANARQKNNPKCYALPALHWPSLLPSTEPRVVPSTHTPSVDSALNDTMRLISGCIRSTPTEQLPVVSGILPPEIRRNTACFKLANRAAPKEDHLLHRAIHQENPIRRLATRRPVGAHLRELMESAADQPAEAWSKEAWQRRWDEAGSRLHTLMPRVSSAPRGCDLPKRAWTQLNRLRTGHGCFRSLLHKMGL